MTENFLNKLLVGFPVLEKLNLSRCDKFQIIDISNVKLRSLGLRCCKRLKHVDVDTLKPCSLDYHGCEMVHAKRKRIHLLFLFEMYSSVLFLDVIVKVLKSLSGFVR